MNLLPLSSQGQYCDICSQGESDRAHPITNAVDGTERWWQSPPLSRSTEFNEVNVTLDLGQLFHVAYVLIKFANSPRPDLWVLERSTDFGQTYLPWQFFASSKRDCIERFGQRTIERINSDDDVACTTEYSRIVPLENGEIVVSLVNGRPGSMNFSYSPVLREFTKATNIRLRFLRTNTLLGHLMGKALRDPTVTRRYYYSIKDISIGGRCVCNGHAEACNAKDPNDPYKLQCDCQHNTCGVSCDQCCPGHKQLPWKPATTYSANKCEPCNCHRHSFDCYYDHEVDQRRGSMDVHGHHRGGGVCLNCQHHTTGVNCERCIPTYYRSPDHAMDSPLACSHGTCEDLTGRCFCKPNYTGENCDSCASGFINFPDCYRDIPNIIYVLFFSFSVSPVCGCSSVGSLPEVCDLSGRCLCKPEFQGPRCEQCRSGFHSYPNCQACQCSAEGSRYTSCDHVTGQCVCLPNVVGLRCDSCAHGAYGFPHCQAGTCHPAGSVHNVGQCECRHHVEGPACDTCKPLYWNLSPDTPDGCSNCECHTAGTLSGVAECAQETGQCHCKPNACSGTCSTCKDGYYNLQEHSYFGCQGCQCDIGGSAGQSCGERNGRCRCRPNVEGAKCNLPRPDHYFPDLHHLKFEIEEGTMLDGRPVRFGYDPLEFRDFSWRGYALMSAIQSKVLVSVSVGSPDLFHVVLRYANRAGSDVRGRVSVIEDGSEQSKQIVFAPSAEPTFVNVPQNNFVEPFVLNPGTWTVVIEAEGILLDYLVLLPSAYYEAPILQIKVTEPCTYSFATDANQNCLLYRYLSLDSFPSISGNDASCRNDNHLPRPCPTERVTPRHPDMAVCSGYDISVELQGRLPARGDYALVVEYSSEEELPQTLSVVVNMPGSRTQQHTVFSTRVHALGRYVFILHYHQPLHPTYPVQVYINGGRIWQGHANASFCPHASGCRNVLISENQIILDVTDHEVFITVQIPAGKTLWLDYVLVVPQASYSSSYLNEEPLDKSYDFISNCGQKSFYINPATASKFCLSSAVSLSAFFNNGALPCACHEVGAESDTCETFGGQCRCRPNVIGRDCSMCATGYWGFPNCRPCNCGSRLCEPVTGDCICPPRTLRPECTQCEPQTFGCHPLVGCEVCNCSRPGIVSLDVGCDTLSGQCRCKNNIVGRQCDRCAPGFYGFPNCRPCDCNEAGTEEEVCNSFTGQCLCKENVQGSRCDQCRVGTFHLDPTNPKGCTSCFCFGATDRCRSSDKRRTEIMNMEGWVLLGADRQEVPVTVYPGQDLVEADLSDVPDVYQDLHWHSPKTYLGDKVSSYGGYLRYRLTTQTMRGDVLSLPAEAHRPDIILKVLNTLSNTHTHTHPNPKPLCKDTHAHRRGSFRHAQTGNSVSREELMMVLVGLESLQVRAIHSQSAHSVSLRGAVLEGAASLPAGRHANNVEICMCPANYLGDSCQKCAPGYYRDTIGLFLGKCVPCNCNGHSDQCLDGSGICSNCRHNTAGDHCEQCQGGFLGNNSVDGQAVSCSSCPCPLRVPSNKEIRLSKKKTSAAAACPVVHRCAPGFYGNPMVLGSRCQPCHCHDNTDPNMLFTDCHPLTGECLSCMHNTAGPHSCDSCVIVLLEDLDQMNNNFSSVAAQLGNLNASSMAWAQLQVLNKTRDIENYNSTLDESRSRADMLDAEIVNINDDIGELQDKVQSRMIPTVTHTHTHTHTHKLQINTKLNGLLDHVNKALAGRHGQNKDLAKAIRDRLARFHSEMMDLRDALNEAVNNTARAAEINNVNEKNLEDNKVSPRDGHGQSREARRPWTKWVTLAKEKSHPPVQHCKRVISQEYERLAAQLDGARTPLAKKVQDFAGAESKIPLVEEAEKHAELLDALAMNLTKCFYLCFCCTELKPQLEEAQKRLDDAKNKQVQVMKDLEKIQNNLNSTTSTHIQHTVNPIQEIDAAKQAADLANTTATQVNDALRPIREQLDQWEQTYGDANATNDDINKALMEANKTVHELGTTIPTLLTKLDRLQNNSIQMPNISENINRIRQLIQQARNAASKVSVPVKFNGGSGVQVRTPANLADMAAYTSLKLYITLPEAARARRQGDGTQQFVFYLGNKDVSITTATQRTLQYGQMSMSSETEGDQRVTKAHVEAGGDQGLLNLLTNDTVFYVGGYPSTFKPPSQLALPNFKGCIELDTLNEEVLSLYNFERTFNLNTTEDTPCGRSVHTVFTRRFITLVKVMLPLGLLFFASNESIFNRPPLSLSLSLSVSVCRPHISMSVRINSSDGLVLHAAGGQRGGAAMSLSVSGGHLLLLLDGGKRKVSLRSRKKYSDDQWHTVRWRSRSGHMTMMLRGDVPGSGGFTGCVKDLTLNEVPAGSPAHSQGTVPCFLNPLQPGAYFSGQGGHIAIGSYVSLLFPRNLLPVRPVSDSGLLLHAGTSPDQHLSLVLSQGEVTVSVNSGKGEFSASFTPEEPLCNGRWHTITVVKKNNVLQLHVDAGSEHSVGPKQSRSAGAKETVYLGGVPDGITVPGLPAALPAFHGCIRQATVNHRPAMLSKPLAVHGAVGTQGCPHM
uniref:Laminin subunit alpha 3 n=1 Tax=Scophthalmus maximus TaxID=52904 RepID=A0A8D3ECX5_SCOMX